MKEVAGGKGNIYTIKYTKQSGGAKNCRCSNRHSSDSITAGKCNSNESMIGRRISRSPPAHWLCFFPILASCLDHCWPRHRRCWSRQENKVYGCQRRQASASVDCRLTAKRSFEGSGGKRTKQKKRIKNSLRRSVMRCGGRQMDGRAGRQARGGSMPLRSLWLMQNADGDWAARERQVGSLGGHKVEENMKWMIHCI